MRSIERIGVDDAIVISGKDKSMSTKYNYRAIRDFDIWRFFQSQIVSVINTVIANHAIQIHSASFRNRIPAEPPPNIRVVVRLG
jgi:hypothetical protein